MTTDHKAAKERAEMIALHRYGISDEECELTAANAEIAKLRGDAERLDWVQQSNMALIPPEHGGHGWLVIRHARAVGGVFIASSSNPRHDPRALRTAIDAARRTEK